MLARHDRKFAEAHLSGKQSYQQEEIERRAAAAAALNTPKWSLGLLRTATKRAEQRRKTEMLAGGAARLAEWTRTTRSSYIILNVQGKMNLVSVPSFVSRAKQEWAQTKSVNWSQLKPRKHHKVGEFFRVAGDVEPEPEDDTFEVQSPSVDAPTPTFSPALGSLSGQWGVRLDMVCESV
mmetsp:Transcript_28250/g.65133  ORF Transcript_28250/g.65133 Transcript_28250/m.65133 type:complete len:179 (+) Transcript_28250:67-603(+)